MTTQERLNYINAYSYFLSDETKQFLLENEEYEVCTSCSWSWLYDIEWSPPCWSCDWKWYTEIDG